jgi:hypothetical protein
MLLVGVLFLMIVPAYAAEQLTYISQPEEVTVFLNNVVFVRDSVVLAGDTEAQIVLPAEMVQETLIVRDGGARVSGYSISRATGQAVLRLAPSGDDLREISLDYLAMA